MSSVRLAIDVGGTFTKGVALRTADGALRQKVVVPTTHDALQGIAVGVIEVLAELMSGRSAPEVEFIGFSTTLAVNALLEGDSVPVGLVAIGPKVSRRQVERATAVPALDAQGQRLRLLRQFLDEEGMAPQSIRAALEELRDDGAGSIAVTAAYGVDRPDLERRVARAASAMGLPVVCGHEMTLAYGLHIRTLTAVVNAALVTRMRSLTRTVGDAATNATGRRLMIMRGDGGVMRIDQFEQRPIEGLLAGPAATLAGAIGHAGVRSGLVVEVGGTSTNIGLILDGAPQMEYVTIGDLPTCVRSIQVRVVGTAGGSLVRLQGRAIASVGPRSAHIAGLPYACFIPAKGLTGATLERTAPRADDAGDHAVLLLRDGRKAAITLTCAATTLAVLEKSPVPPGTDRRSATAALTILGEALGCSAGEAAEAMLHQAVRGIDPAVSDILRRAKGRRLTIYGGGGGATVLVPALAHYLDLPYEITPDADVLSSIGVACAPVRAEVEGPCDDLAALRRVLELAEARAYEYGAQPGTVVVHGSLLAEHEGIRAAATGAATGSRRVVTRSTATRAAADSLGTDPQDLELAYQTEHHWIFNRPATRRWWSAVRPAVAVVDDFGTLTFLAEDAAVVPPARKGHAISTESCRPLALIDDHRVIELPRRLIEADALPDVGTDAPVVAIVALG